MCAQPAPQVFGEVIDERADAKRTRAPVQMNDVHRNRLGLKRLQYENKPAGRRGFHRLIGQQPDQT